MSLTTIDEVRLKDAIEVLKETVHAFEQVLTANEDKKQSWADRGIDLLLKSEHPIRDALLTFPNNGGEKNE